MDGACLQASRREGPDLGLVVYAEWVNGTLRILNNVANPRADSRISVRSDDLVALSNGDLPFGRAYATNRLRIDASMTDLLRLRSVI